VGGWKGQEEGEEEKVKNNNDKDKDIHAPGKRKEAEKRNGTE